MCLKKKCKWENNNLPLLSRFGTSERKITVRGVTKLSTLLLYLTVFLKKQNRFFPGDIFSGLFGSLDTFATLKKQTKIIKTQSKTKHLEKNA